MEAIEVGHYFCTKIIIMHAISLIRQNNYIALTSSYIFIGVITLDRLFGAVISYKNRHSIIVYCILVNKYYVNVINLSTILSH